MDVSWVKKRHLHENGEPSYIEGKLRSIGDQIIYGCPNNMLTDNRLSVPPQRVDRQVFLRGTSGDGGGAVRHDAVVAAVQAAMVGSTG